MPQVPSLIRAGAVKDPCTGLEPGASTPTGPQGPPEKGKKRNCGQTNSPPTTSGASPSCIL